MNAIRKKLDQALKSGKYFITISYKKNQETRQDDLQHFWVTKDYPKDSLIPSLDHIRNEIVKTEGLETKHEPKTRNSVHDW